MVEASTSPEGRVVGGAAIAALYLGGVAASAFGVAFVADMIAPKDAGPYERSYITAAVPFFILLILWEVVVGLGKRSTGGKYELADSMSSIAAGTFQVITESVFLKPTALSVFVYAYIHEHFRIVDLPINSFWTHLIAFLLADVAYYVVHRTAHEVNWLWVQHSIHHSSEHYNLSTALRQSVLHAWVSWLYYMPIALLVPLPVYSVHRQWNTLYQFWVHTTIVRRLGVFEWIFSTPSHHRVHHDRRVHANYAGILIIWDRMFGSFLDEGEGYDPNANFLVAYDWPKAVVLPNDENVVYGVLHPIGSWNPLRVQLDPAFDLARRCWQNFPDLSGVSKLFWSGPGYRPHLKRDKMPPINGAVPRIRYQSKLVAASTIYHITQFLIAVVVTFIALAVPLPAAFTVGAAVCSLYYYIAQGVAMDSRPYAHSFELVRLILTFGLVYVATHVEDEQLPGWWSTAGHVYIALLVASVLAVVAMPTTITGVQTQNIKTTKTL